MAPPRPPHRGPSLIASTKEREFGAKSRRLGQKIGEARNRCDSGPLFWWRGRDVNPRPSGYGNDPALLPRMARARTRPQRPPSVGPMLHFPVLNTVVGIIGRLAAR